MKSKKLYIVRIKDNFNIRFTDKRQAENMCKKLDKMGTPYHMTIFVGTIGRIIK